MKGTNGSERASSAVLTLPNALSFLRIALIPVFAVLIVRRNTTTAGILLFSAVAATDWVDGWVARRTSRVTELGRILDPVADRLAIAAFLVALVARGAFPVWAASLVLARDAAVLLVGAFVLVRWSVRIDVRPIGKAATLTLMVAVPAIAWGTMELPLAPAALVLGWPAFVTGVVAYYLAAGVYVRDIRQTIALRR